MDTLGNLLLRNQKLYGDDEAYMYNGRRGTYRDLAQRGLRLASALHRLGMRHQDRVSVLAMNCSQYLEAYAAANLAGFILGTVNYRLTSAEVAYVVQDSSPSVFIFEEEYTAIAAELRNSLTSIRNFVCIGNGPDWALNYEALIGGETSIDLPIQASSDDYAHLMYSSGTTGRPKGIIKTHRAEIARAEIFAGQFRLMQNERAMVMMPLFHTGATSIMLASNWVGGSIVLHRRFDPEAVLRDIEEKKIAMTHMAPTIIRTLLDHPSIGAYDLSSLKLMLYASAPMPVALLRRALDRFGPILANGYGMTEGGGTFLQKHHHKPDGSEAEKRRLYSVGQPIAHAKIRIVNEKGENLPPDQPGEIVIKSPTNMACYWNNEKSTRETLRNGWLHTGDIGAMDEHGFLYLVDRKKDMIISGGETSIVRR